MVSLRDKFEYFRFTNNQTIEIIAKGDTLIPNS